MVCVYVETAVSPACIQLRDTVLVRMSALQIRIMFAIENERMRCCNECCEVSELLAGDVVCSQDERTTGEEYQGPRRDGSSLGLVNTRLLLGTTTLGLLPSVFREQPALDRINARAQA